MRIGFFGGGTEGSPYAEEHGGKVLNCTIDNNVSCILKPIDQPGITIRSLDLSAVRRAVTGLEWDGKLSLPQAVIDAHPEINGVEIYSAMCHQIQGLGSSSAFVVSMLKLLDTTQQIG